MACAAPIHPLRLERMELFPLPSPRTHLEGRGVLSQVLCNSHPGAYPIARWSGTCTWLWPACPHSHPGWLFPLHFWPTFSGSIKSIFLPPHFGLIQSRRLILLLLPCSPLCLPLRENLTQRRLQNVVKRMVIPSPQHWPHIPVESNFGEMDRGENMRKSNWLLICKVTVRRKPNYTTSSQATLYALYVDLSVPNHLLAHCVLSSPSVSTLNSL